MNVNIVTNPLKTLKVYHLVTKTAANKEQNDFRFTVPLNPNYFDLSEGVWNVAITEFILENKSSTPITNIVLLNVSTNLLSQAIRNPYVKNTQHISRPTPLATLFASKMKARESLFDRFTPIYFQIENSCAYSFDVIYSEVPTNIHDILNLGVHVTFLFQRIR